jgi:7-cyano-7-deazaguanine synthase in queuosine biosynthesis
MNTTTLLAVSGGLDSTYVLWDWLRSHPNERISIFHVNLRHKAEDRLHVESQAYDKIIVQLNKLGLSNFNDLGHVHFSYGTLPRITIKDIQIVAMFKSIILKTYPTIDTVLLSWHKGEVDRDDIKRGYRVKSMFKALEVDRAIKLEFPIEHKTRAEMVAELPENLLSLVHSCRKPKVGKRVCGQCKTCLEYIEENLKPL